MRKLLSIFTIAVIAVCSIFVTGCDSSSLSEDYYTPNINYKGMDFKCYSDGDKFTIVRNDMVYTDFSKFVMEDLNSKGNKITSIDIEESEADVYHDNQTVAVLKCDIKSESGDIKSGEYYISAYFTYDMKDQADVKMYLMNYCFSKDYDVDTSLFDDCYNKIKDKL